MKITLDFTAEGWREFADDVGIRLACGGISPEGCSSDLVVVAVYTAGQQGQDATVTIPTLAEYVARLVQARGG